MSDVNIGDREWIFLHQIITVSVRACGESSPILFLFDLHLL